jgi:hypothetical protein
MGEIVTYKQNANSGDLVASMPGMQHVYRQLGKKAVIQQRLNVPASYYQGAIHPIRDSNDRQVTMNEKQWNMLKPLLEAQEYVERCEVWEGQPTDIDFDIIRSGTYTTLGFGSINRWPFYVHPLLACDLSVPWIDVPESPAMKILMEGNILCNFTCRYREPLITYYFLKEYEDRLIFAGTKEEHETFCEENKLSMPYLNVSNFLELAQAIKSCKFLLSNQSMQWNIAEGMKHMRVLEVCRSASNCIPNGPNGYDYLHQNAVEIYVKKFMKQ